MTDTVIERGHFATPVDGDAVAAEWAARGYDCHRFADPAGQEWNDFVHATDELLTVQSGVLEATVAGQTLRVEPGDELFIPARARHSVRNVHSGTTRWLFGYN